MESILTNFIHQFKHLIPITIVVLILFFGTITGYASYFNLFISSDYINLNTLLYIIDNSYSNVIEILIIICSFGLWLYLGLDNYEDRISNQLRYISAIGFGLNAVSYILHIKTVADNHPFFTAFDLFICFIFILYIRKRKRGLKKIHFDFKDLDMKFEHTENSINKIKQKINDNIPPEITCVINNGLDKDQDEIKRNREILKQQQISITNQYNPLDKILVTQPHYTRHKIPN